MIYRTVLAALMVVCATAFLHNSMIKTRKTSSSISMAKKLSFREDSRKSLVEGINVVANAVKVAYFYFIIYLETIFNYLFVECTFY